MSRHPHLSEYVSDAVQSLYNLILRRLIDRIVIRLVLNTPDPTKSNFPSSLEDLVFRIDNFIRPIESERPVYKIEFDEFLQSILLMASQRLKKYQHFSNSMSFEIGVILTKPMSTLHDKLDLCKDWILDIPLVTPKYHIIPIRSIDAKQFSIDVYTLRYTQAL